MPALKTEMIASGTSTAAPDEPKKAVVVAASQGYLPGLVATLNGLDYHGNNMDFYWIWHDEGGGETKAAEHLMDCIADAGLSFPVYAVPLSGLIDLWPEGAERERGWQFRFYKYPLMLSLGGEDFGYDVVGALSGDTLVVNFIEPWWDMFAGTRYMSCTNHSWAGVGHIMALEAKHAFSHTTMTDVPIVCDPCRWADVLMSIYEKALTVEETCVEIKSFNWAVFTHGRQRDMVYLVESAWVTHHLWYLRVRSSNIAGRRMYCVDDGVRFWLNTVHGSWRSRDNCDTKARQGVEAGNEKLGPNVKLVHNEYVRLITEHKLQPGYEEDGPWQKDMTLYE